MKIILAIFLAVSFSGKIFADQTAAETAKKVPVKEGFAPMDMNQFKGISSGQPEGNSKIKIEGKCKTSSGAEIKVGDNGYDLCVRQSELDKANNKKSGAENTIGVTFGK